MAESTVKTVKRLFKESHRSNQDILKGLLIPRNAAIKYRKSPAGLMMGRILRDLPRLQPTTSSAHRRDLQQRADAKHFHDANWGPTKSILFNSKSGNPGRVHGRVDTKGPYH